MTEVTGRGVKDGLYDQFARIGKAVADPKRIELVDLLCQGERSVEVLAEAAALSVTNASAHLKVLRADPDWWRPAGRAPGSTTGSAASRCALFSLPSSVTWPLSGLPKWR